MWAGCVGTKGGEADLHLSTAGRGILAIDGSPHVQLKALRGKDDLTKPQAESAVSRSPTNQRTPGKGERLGEALTTVEWERSREVAGMDGVWGRGPADPSNLVFHGSRSQLSGRRWR
ncbi:hypothetical protein Bbelb_384240 [Branchiostoma belcheri]|nr:hypothetical protein Bbelb_441760 [Branchiostoma belcheri]KAI8483897.1 hypothetical protein Bbelb_384240 [Branchiostoma belcheri]